MKKLNTYYRNYKKSKLNIDDRNSYLKVIFFYSIKNTRFSIQNLAEEIESRKRDGYNHTPIHIEQENVITFLMFCITFQIAYKKQ